MLTRATGVLVVTASLEGGQAVLRFQGMPTDRQYSFVTPGSESSTAGTAALTLTFGGKQYRSNGQGTTRFHRYLAPTFSNIAAPLVASDGTERSFTGALVCDGLREE